MSFAEPTAMSYDTGQPQFHYDENSQTNYPLPNQNSYAQPPPPNYQPNPPQAEQTEKPNTCFKTLKAILRVILILIGLMLVTLGVFSIIYMSFKPFHIVTVFLAAYVILFGFMLFFAEFRWPFFLKKFPFLLTRGNRGFFMMFVGTLCFGMYIKTWQWPCYVVGGWVIFWGAVYVVQSCLVSDLKEDELKSKVQADFEQQNNPNAAAPPKNNTLPPAQPQSQAQWQEQV